MSNRIKKGVFTDLISEVKSGNIDGFTLGLNLTAAPEKGYMVGTGAGEFDAAPMNRMDINSKMSQVYNTFSGDRFLGAWRNGDEVIVEISEHVKDLGDALKLGKANNQKAIWDLANEKDIYL